MTGPIPLSRLNFTPVVRKNRRHTKFLLASLILAAALGSQIIPRLWGVFLYSQQVRSLQAECLAYTASTTQIIYDTDPADHQKLLALGGGYRAFNDWAVFHVPAAWHDFRGSYDCPDGTAYVHARTSPGGHQRLVAVDIIPIRRDAIELRPSIADLAPRWDVKKLETCRSSKGRPGDEWTAKANSAIRIYAGQSDPHDASRFTIPADFGNGVVSIRGQLQDDDTVTVQRP